MYRFKISVGDWSNDGHGIEEQFVIESNLPVQQVRETYFSACNELGFSLDNSYKSNILTPCGEYEDNEVSIDTIDALRAFGLVIDTETEDAWVDGQMETEQMCDLVLALIMVHNPAHQLWRIPAEEMETFHFYGYDDKKRHIGYFGYGLFSL